MTTSKKVGIAILVGVGALWLYSYLKKNSTPKSSLDNTDNSTVTDNTATTDNTVVKPEIVTGGIKPSVINTPVYSTTSSEPFGSLTYAGSSASDMGGGGGAEDWNFRHLQDVQRKLMKMRGTSFDWGSDRGYGSGSYQDSTTMLTYGGGY